MSFAGAPLSASGVRLAAIELGFAERGGQWQTENLAFPDARSEAQERTLAKLDDLGIDYDLSQNYSIEECVSIRRHRERFEREKHWESLEGERYDRFTEATGPSVWSDDPGTGKTTNAGLGALKRERPHVVLFDKHEKALKYCQKDIIQKHAPEEGYLHLKGGSQPRHKCCFDAQLAVAESDEAPVCPEHGPPDDWDRMCPLYEHDSESSIRRRFDVLSEIRSYRTAHDELCPDETCAWAAQYEELEEQDYIVGVHQHQLLPAIRDGYDTLVDETPSALIQTDRWTTTELQHAVDILRCIPGPVADVLASFTDELIHTVVRGNISEFSPPQKIPRITAERLAEIKIEFYEFLQFPFEFGEWSCAPACFDTILAALAECNIAPDACRNALSAPATLDRCPQCHSPTEVRDETFHCPTCYWDEERFSLLKPPGQRPFIRTTTYIERSDTDGATNRFCMDLLPAPRSLPDAPLILDATATPKKIAGLYHVPLADLDVPDTPTFEMNARIVQIIDGQYHAGTIEGPKEVRETGEQTALQQRLQAAIDTIGAAHDTPLFVLKRSLIRLFEFPDHATVRHYGGTRGLDYDDCDAVVCLGAFHPNISALKREARLLAMGHDDLRVGGLEYSTRRDASGELAEYPPVYRKLDYEDEAGRGRAVPTKHYSGLVGALFREYHEKELEQIAHRVRPIPAEEQKHIYLLTNVPTSLPVDDLIELDDITNPPLRSLLPVPERAITHLVEPLHDLLDGEELDSVETDLRLDRTDDRVTTGISGLHEISRVAGADRSEATVRRWANGLVDLGLLARGGNKYAEGYRYTADRATFTRALRVLSSNAGVKVGAVKRLREKARAADGSAEWLDWAVDAFNISGAGSGDTEAT